MQTLKTIKHTLDVCSERVSSIETTITEKKHTPYYAQLLKEVIEELNVAMYELKQIK